MAHVVTADPWGLEKLLSGCLWLRSWLRQHKEYAGRVSGAEEGGPLFAGLARVKFGLGIAASGITTS